MLQISTDFHKNDLFSDFRRFFWFKHFDRFWLISTDLYWSYLFSDSADHWLINRFRQILRDLHTDYLFSDFTRNSEWQISTNFHTNYLFSDFTRNLEWQISTNFERFAHQLSVSRFYQKFRVTDFNAFWEIFTPNICFQILAENTE